MSHSQWGIEHHVPVERECITCGRKIKPDERAFRVDGTSNTLWKCDDCQFKFDERLENASNSKEERRKLNREQKARLREKAPIYHSGQDDGS